MFLLSEVATAATGTATPKEAAEPPAPFTYCGPRILKLVVNGREIPKAQWSRFQRCEPMMSRELSANAVSVDAALGRIVKATLSQDGTTLHVTTGND